MRGERWLGIVGLTMAVACSAAGGAAAADAEGSPAALALPLCTGEGSHVVQLEWPARWAAAGGVVDVELRFADGEVRRESLEAGPGAGTFFVARPAGGAVTLAAGVSGSGSARGELALSLPACERGVPGRPGGPPPGPSDGRDATTRGRAFTRDVMGRGRGAVLEDRREDLGRWADDFTAGGGLGDGDLSRCDTPACKSADAVESLQAKPDRTLTASWVADVFAAGWIDPQVAAGPTHLVVTASGDGGGIAIYEKNGRLATEDRFGRAIDNPVSEEEFFAWLRPLIDPTLNLGLLGGFYEDGKLVYGIDEFYDTRVVYDPFRDRFWIAALGRNSKAREGNLVEQQFRRSKLLVAVSTTDDPRDRWRFYWFDAVPGDGDCLDSCGCEGSDYVPGAAADYPSLGVNQDAVVITNAVADNNKLGLACLPFDDDRRHTLVTRLDADAFAAGTNDADDVVVYTRFEGVDGELAAGTIQPALHHTPTPAEGGGRPFFALGTHGGDRAVVWAFYAAPPRIERLAVPVEPFFSNADDREGWKVRQKVGPGLTLARRMSMGWTVGNSVLEAVYRDGRLHGVWTDCRRWGDDLRCMPSIRLLRLDVGGFPARAPTATGAGAIDRTFGGRNSFDDPEGAVNAYAWPTLEVNGGGDVVVSYLRAGEALYPEGRYTIHRAAAADVSSSSLLAAGEFTLGGEAKPSSGAIGRLDVTGASVEPVDDRGIWIAQPRSVLADPAKPAGRYELVVGRVFGRGRPDLVVQHFERAAPSGGVAGPAAAAEVAVTVRNQGDAAAPATLLRLLRSTDAEQDPFDPEVGLIAVPPLAPGAEIELAETIEMPTGLQATLYVLTLVDDSHQAEEYSEGNNLRSHHW